MVLEELGHPQPPTPIHCDNAMATGIVNGTVKRQRSRSMEMRYFYACDQVENGHFNVIWVPGAELLADYPSKNHEMAHHRNVRPYYVHKANSPCFLPRAMTPKDFREVTAAHDSKSRDLRGCVGIRSGGYAMGRPLPIIPRTRSRDPHVEVAACLFPPYFWRECSRQHIGVNVRSVPGPFVQSYERPVPVRAFPQTQQLWD